MVYRKDNINYYKVYLNKKKKQKGKFYIALSNYHPKFKLLKIVDISFKASKNT
jgi:hypothetical protein